MEAGCATKSEAERTERTEGTRGLAAVLPGVGGAGLCLEHAGGVAGDGHEGREGPLAARAVQAHVVCGIPAPDKRVPSKQDSEFALCTKMAGPCTACPCLVLMLCTRSQCVDCDATTDCSHLHDQ